MSGYRYQADQATSVFIAQWGAQMRIQPAVFAKRGLRYVDRLGAAAAPLGLPLLFLAMLLPLTLQGVGVLSVDYWLKRRWLGVNMMSLRMVAA